MRIFISWSDEPSGSYAMAIHEWLPNVLQEVKPWISKKIEKGQRWASELAAELEKTNFGIICLTPNNLDSTWLHFEAGAITKFLGEGRAMVYLFGLKPTDVTGPLSQFQHTSNTKDETLALLQTINKNLKEPLKDAKLEQVFEKWWPDLRRDFEGIEKKDTKSKKPKPRKPEEMLEELLVLARDSVQRGARIEKAILAGTRVYPLFLSGVGGVGSEGFTVGSATVDLSDLLNRASGAPAVPIQPSAGGLTASTSLQSKEKEPEKTNTLVHIRASKPGQLP